MYSNIIFYGYSSLSCGLICLLWTILAVIIYWHLASKLVYILNILKCLLYRHKNFKIVWLCYYESMTTYLLFSLYLYYSLGIFEIHLVNAFVLIKIILAFRRSKMAKEMAELKEETQLIKRSILRFELLLWSRFLSIPDCSYFPFLFSWYFYWH